MAQPYWDAGPSVPGAPVIMALVCNGTDYRGNGGQLQIQLASLLACSLRHLNSSVERIALSYGFGSPARSALLEAGWRVIDATATPTSEFANKVVTRDLASRSLHRFPREPQGSFVDRSVRSDCVCTSVKYLAWNMTRFSGGVLLVDTDNVFTEDPQPWLEARSRSGEYFAANAEKLQRNYYGLNGHMLFLRPSAILFEVLRNLGRYGDFVPFLNGEQDVLESVFAPHRELSPRWKSHGKQPAGTGVGIFPQHAHGKHCACNRGHVYYNKTAGRQTPTSYTLILGPGVGCCPQLFETRFRRWFPL